MKIMLRGEAFNLLNHPNFAVPSNTQNPIALGGNGDAVFKDSAGDFANNVRKGISRLSTVRVRFSWCLEASEAEAGSEFQGAGLMFSKLGRTKPNSFPLDGSARCDLLRCLAGSGTNRKLQ